MTLLDISQEKNILDELVITKFETLIPLLKIINNNKNVNNNELRKISKFSGGKIYHCVKGLKTLKLVQNGNGLTITDLGKRFILAYNSSNNGMIKEFLKEACLNVPLFKKIYEENKEVQDPKILYKLFEKEILNTYSGIDPKLIGSAVRRYSQGVHNKKIRVGARLYEKKNKEEKQKEKKSNNIKNIDDIVVLLTTLKNNLNLSPAEIQGMINSLPEGKREELISKIFSKVF